MLQSNSAFRVNAESSFRKPSSHNFLAWKQETKAESLQKIKKKKIKNEHRVFNVSA